MTSPVSAATGSPSRTSRERASNSFCWASLTKAPKRTTRGMKSRERMATDAIAHGHSRAARTSQVLTTFPLSRYCPWIAGLRLLRRFLVFLAQDLDHLAEAAVAVEELDLLQALEDVLRIEAVPRRGPFLLDDQAHHRIVVDGLAGEAAVLHDLPDLEELLGRHGIGSSFSMKIINYKGGGGKGHVNSGSGGGSRRL